MTVMYVQKPSVFRASYTTSISPFRMAASMSVRDHPRRSAASTIVTRDDSRRADLRSVPRATRHRSCTRSAGTTLPAHLTILHHEEAPARYADQAKYKLGGRKRKVQSGSILAWRVVRTPDD